MNMIELQKERQRELMWQDLKSVGFSGERYNRKFGQLARFEEWSKVALLNLSKHIWG